MTAADWRRSWSDERIATLCELYAAGRTMAEIGAELGATRSAVAGQVARLRLSSDPRIASQRRPRNRTVETRAPQIARLADAMADGCPSIDEAARRIGVTPARADQLWLRVRRQLGVQSA